MEVVKNKVAQTGSIETIAYDAVARLFHYPDERYKSILEKACNVLAESYPMAAEELVSFNEYCAQATLIEIQELYLRSFDVQAITTLDLGFVMFGDDYKRGQLLVHLNREHREAGNNIETELADHLPNVLRLLPRMADRELAAELVQRLIGPAIWKMIQDFDPDKIQKKDVVYKKHHKTILDVSLHYRTIFGSLLKAVIEILESDFGYYKVEENSSDFIQKIGAEMKIESDHDKNN